MRYQQLTGIMLLLFGLSAGVSFYRDAKTGSFDKNVILAAGYGGSIFLAMDTDNNSRITTLKALTHNETPSYVGDLNVFLRQFTGKGPKDPLTLGKDIDGITRATMTSSGITRAVWEKIRPSPNEPLSTVNLLPWFIAFFLLALACVAVTLNNSPLRWLTLSGGFVFFGIYERSMLSIIQVINAGMLHFPPLSVNTLWLICLAIGFLPALVIGRIYCGYLCPFALVQEILNKIIPRRYRPAPISAADARTGKKIKYAFLIGLVALCIIQGNAAPAGIEPFITLFTWQGTPLGWGLLALMLILSSFYFRFWCVTLCPVGALTGLVARSSLFRPVPAGPPCGNCQQCADKCPTKAIEADPTGMPAVDMAECILCGQCFNPCASRRKTTAGFMLKCSHDQQ